MTLWDLTQGASAKVSRFKADIENGYRTRLSELGFIPGNKLPVYYRLVWARQNYTASITLFTLSTTVSHH